MNRVNRYTFLFIITFSFSSYCQSWIKMNIPDENAWYRNIAIINNGTISITGISGALTTTNNGITWQQSLNSCTIFLTFKL